MAKTIAVDMNRQFTFRQRNKAGEWKDRHFTLGEMYEAYESECEDAGEEALPLGEWVAEMAQYGCRREMALDKDQTRYDKGQKPHTVYTARVHVEEARKNADQVREEAKARLAAAIRLGHFKPTAPKGSPARGEQVKAKHEAKQAAKADSSGGASHGMPEGHATHKPLWMSAAGL